MTVREIALSLLSEHINEGKYINLSLSSHKADNLSKEDRSLLTALLYKTVERKITLDYFISSFAKRSTDKIDKRVLNILRLGLTQILYFDKIPDYATVNESVAMAKNKGEKAFVNAVLRTAVRQKDSLPYPEREKNVARYLSIYYSFPIALVRRFTDIFGIDTACSLFESFNKVSPLTVTVNLKKTDRDSYLKMLKENGFDAEATKISNIGITLSGSVSPKELPGFDEGLFFVQDEASQISALALDPKNNSKVIDVCACPGGKSFAVSSITAGTAEILARDIHNSKLSLIESGKARLGFDRIVTEEFDATELDAALIGKLDFVICDAPCSGLGVLGKKADLRYKELDSVSSLPDLQLKILKNASSYLKVGGTLVYSTCTLLPSENREVVDKFLSDNDSFKPLDFDFGGVRSEGGSLTLLPHIHNTDGFFITKMVKIK